MRKDFYRKLFQEAWVAETKKDNDKNKEERYSGKEKLISISSLGSCYKKNIYRSLLTPEKEPVKSSPLRARQGTVLHDDVQKSILNQIDLIKSSLKKAGKNVVTIETEVRFDLDDGFIGHADVVIIFDNKEAHVIDFKFVHDFSYQKAFGIKRNRDKNALRQYKMQIVQYARQIEKMGENIKVTRAEIMYFRKSDANCNSIVIDGFDRVSIEEDIDRYVRQLNNLKRAPIEAINRFEWNGVPFEKWECDYCPFLSRCKGE